MPWVRFIHKTRLKRIFRWFVVFSSQNQKKAHFRAFFDDSRFGLVWEKL
jgi:hypothetical protein